MLFRSVMLERAQMGGKIVLSCACLSFCFKKQKLKNRNTLESKKSEWEKKKTVWNVIPTGRELECHFNILGSRFVSFTRLTQLETGG